MHLSMHGRIKDPNERSKIATPPMFQICLVEVKVQLSFGQKQRQKTKSRFRGYLKTDLKAHAATSTEV